MNSMQFKTAQASIYKAIDEMIIAGQEKRLRTPGLHASTVREKDFDRKGEPLFCLRYSVLVQHFTVEEKETDPYQIAVWRMGEKIHDMLQEWAVNAGVAEAVEFNGNHKRYNLSFHPDLLLKKIKGQNYLLEAKGYGEKYWQEYVDAGVPPKDAHEQVNLYLHLMREVYGRDDFLGLLWIYNKNQRKDPERGFRWYWVWIVEYNPEMVKPYQERLDKIMVANSQFVLSGELPPRICDSPDVARAQKCRLRDVCFSSVQARKALLAAQ